MQCNALKAVRSPCSWLPALEAAANQLTTTTSHAAYPTCINFNAATDRASHAGSARFTKVQPCRKWCLSIRTHYQHCFSRHMLQGLRRRPERQTGAASPTCLDEPVLEGVLEESILRRSPCLLRIRTHLVCTTTLVIVPTTATKSFVTVAIRHPHGRMQSPTLRKR